MQDEDEIHTSTSPDAHHHQQQQQQLSESQEIVVGNSGRAILLGDELADLESVHHGRSSSYPSTNKSGGVCCPAWLRNSSPRIKAVLGLTGIILLAFVAVLIVGVTTQLNDDGSGGGSSGIQSDKNVVTDLGVNSTPAPTTSPTPAKPNESVSAVNIMLSDSLERIVPNFSDGVTANEQQNWDILEEQIEITIYEAFSDRLPEGYKLQSVQIEKFDGFDTTDLRKMRRRSSRQLQTNSVSNAAPAAVHAVLYASSVTVDCAAVDCTTAADTVADTTLELSQLDFLEVEEEDAVVAETTDAPVGSSSSPTQSPIASISSLAPTTLAPNLVTISESPTMALTNVTEGPLPLFIREELCSVDSLCGRCEGECTGDDSCSEGLLCFIRMGYEYITGCLGPGEPGQSYCYDPLSEGYANVLSDDNMCDRKSPCEKCRGACDADEDCATNLYCFGRGGYETVPGCAGQGSFGTDYCFDPNDIEEF